MARFQQPAAEVAIVVVTWQSAGDVPALLASLAPTLAAGAELVVVDNASSDDTAAVVRRAAPDAVLIANAVNRGFAAGANQGLAASTRPFVLFLNPDTVVAPERDPAGARVPPEPALGRRRRLSHAQCRRHAAADRRPLPQRPWLDRRGRSAAATAPCAGRCRRRAGSSIGSTAPSSSDAAPRSRPSPGSTRPTRCTGRISTSVIACARPASARRTAPRRRSCIAGIGAGRNVTATTATWRCCGDAALLPASARSARRVRIPRRCGRELRAARPCSRPLGARGGDAAAARRARRYGGMARLCLSGDPAGRRADRARLRVRQAPGIEGRDRSAHPGSSKAQARERRWCRS